MGLEQSPAIPRLRRLGAQAPTTLAEKLRWDRNLLFLNLAEKTWDNSDSSKNICLQWSLAMRKFLSTAFDESLRLYPPPSEVQISLFGYGKLGANELNLSSDVDLMVVSSKEWEHRAWIRCFQQLVGEVTSFGMVARIDFDLRPFGRSGPLVPTAEQFEDYFGNFAETWERLAFIRLDLLAGDHELGNKILAWAQSFSFRKHLDFGMKTSLAEMRQKIFAANWSHRERGEINLKLDPGGIRDLELFLQTILAIHGGRKPQFRVKETDTCLDLLASENILPLGDIDFLRLHYWQLRHEENRLQAFTDQQIHTCNPSFLENPETLLGNMQKCSRMVDSFLGPIKRDQKSLPNDLTELQNWLTALQVPGQLHQRILDLAVPPTQVKPLKLNDLIVRSRFLYLVINEIYNGPTIIQSTKNSSLEQVLNFVESLKNKTSYYHLLVENDGLRQELSQLCQLSPTLVSRLMQRPEMLDGFLFGQTPKLTLSQDWQEFLESLLDFKLLSESRLGLTIFEKASLTEDVLGELTAVADRIATLVLHKLQIELGSQIKILALGKWGAREIGFQSDLDYLLLTDDAQPKDQSLLVRVARRWISHISQPQKGGSLYRVDSRLRPQALNHSTVIPFTQLLTHLATSSQAWERLAYLRSRLLHAEAENKQIYMACLHRPLADGELKELNSIRLSLYENQFCPLDLKYAVGGLVDCELAVGAALLRHQLLPNSSQMLDQIQCLTAENKEWQSLSTLYSQLRRLEARLDLRFPTWRNKDFASHFHELPEGQEIAQILSQSTALLARLDPRRLEG